MVLTAKVHIIIQRLANTVLNYTVFHYKRNRLYLFVENKPVAPHLQGFCDAVGWLFSDMSCIKYSLQ